MEYRRLGRSGLEVSAVGLGTNNFGRRLNLEQTERVIRQTIELGINLLDTSNSYGYGLSEEYIGKSVKGIRSQVVLATKAAQRMGLGPNQGGASRRHIMEQVEASLKRLEMDYIDLYQMHYPDPSTPIEETLRTLDDLVRQGKVRYIGCSNYAAWQVAEAVSTSRALRLETYISIQPEYSMLNREVEKELVPCCQALGLGILPYYPLANGFLTGKYRRGEAAPEGTRLAAASQRAQAIPTEVKFDTLARQAAASQRAQATLTEANFDILARLEAFAADRGHPVVELAIAWLLANPPVGSVIAGATRPEQVVANARAADWHLTPAEMQEIDGILKGGA